MILDPKGSCWRSSLVTWYSNEQNVPNLAKVSIKAFGNVEVSEKVPQIHSYLLSEYIIVFERLFTVHNCSVVASSSH